VEKQEGKRRKGKAAHLCVIDSSSNQFRIDSIHRLTIIEQDLVVAILQKERRERGSVYGIPSKQTPFLSLSLSRLTFVSQWHQYNPKQPSKTRSNGSKSIPSTRGNLSSWYNVVCSSTNGIKYRAHQRLVELSVDGRVFVCRAFFEEEGEREGREREREPRRNRIALIGQFGRREPIWTINSVELFASFQLGTTLPSLNVRERERERVSDSILPNLPRLVIE